MVAGKWRIANDIFSQLYTQIALMPELIAWGCYCCSKAYNDFVLAPPPETMNRDNNNDESDSPLERNIAMTKKISRILVVDKDSQNVKNIESALNKSEFQVIATSLANEGLDILSNGKEVDVCLLDLSLPDLSGSEVMEKFLSVNKPIPIIYLTDKHSSEAAIEMTQRGAYDYLVKPIDGELFAETIRKARDMHQQMKVPLAKPHETTPEESRDRIVGASPQMQEVYKNIGRVAAQDVTVLIYGESGTGKELVAKSIHHHSDRSKKPFVTVNCAAIPASLLESELFGHEKGAFTGAAYRRIGKFEQCRDGTIFLDEIGDMPMELQTKILRVLQCQQFERIGGNETVECHTRILAATNRDLEKMVQEGEFREDLYYRLRGFVIHLPPLRERDGDLDLLVQHFLAQFGRDLDSEVSCVAEEVMEKLRSYSWPGNVRELENVIKQMLVQSNGPVLISDFLPEFDAMASKDATSSGESEAGVISNSGSIEQFIEKRIADHSENLYQESLELFERFLLQRVLREVKGNQSRAAKMLGITRGSLRNKIQALDIEIRQVVELSKES
jgi:two-component system nitrogen regulation response regulator GlnG